MFTFATKFSPEAANFEKAAVAGFEFAELFLTPTRLMSWRSLSKISRSYDLSYALHFPSVGKLTDQTCEELVALARDLNCSNITVHEQDLENAKTITKMDDGIRLAVENHQVTFESLDAWMADQTAITLNIDYLWKLTLNHCERHELCSVVRRLLHWHRDQILAIHLSGYTPDQSVRRPLFQSPEMISQLWDVFHGERYRGLVVGEIATPYQQMDNLAADVKFFQNWLEKKQVSRLTVIDNQRGSEAPVGKAAPAGKAV